MDMVGSFQVPLGQGLFDVMEHSMGRVKTNKPRRERPTPVTETHEPAQPLSGWPRSHARAELTGMDQMECVKITVHGVDHYLHATTARELHNDLGRVLDEYNEICRKHGAPEV